MVGSRPPASSADERDRQGDTGTAAGGPATRGAAEIFQLAVSSLSILAMLPSSSLSSKIFFQSGLISVSRP